MSCQSEHIENTKILILRSIGLIYSISFTSWYYQLSELYGVNGLLPIKLVKFDEFVPSIFYYNKSEEMLSLVCLLGSILGMCTLLFQKCVNTPSFIILWVLYLSLFYVGQDFIHFQWDTMLLEAGFIAILFTQFSLVGRELFRWLAFKLYFSSGILKLLSQCPTWWNLSALEHHFQSQCIPHVLSWWAHQLPTEVKKFMTAAQFVTLIAGSLAFYFPLRSVRIYGFILQVIMQISIMLTGNYNFFNLLAIIVTFSVIDDEFIDKYFPSYLNKFFNFTIVKQTTPNRNRLIIEAIFCLYITLVIFMAFFPIESIMSDQKLPFTVEDIGKYFLTQDNFFYLSSFVLCFFFIYVIYFNVQNSQSNDSNFMRVLKTLINILLFVFMFNLSSYSFQRGFGIQSPVTIIDMKDIYIKSYPYYITSSYGLFRKMTGVGGRPELIFEVSQDGRNWKEETFMKPGPLNQMPPFLIPHQARLDWQLWFAALTEQPQDRYLIHLVFKLLHKQNVQYVRIQKYLYYMTNLREIKASGNFWKRTFKSTYLGPISLQDPQLMKLKKELQFLGNPIKEDLIQFPLLWLLFIVICLKLLL